MRNNNHIKCNHGEEYCGCFPKHLKSYYDISKAGMYFDFNDYRDVPGWINDAELIYPKMVENAQDGFHFVEIGVLFGQSTTHITCDERYAHKLYDDNSLDFVWIDGDHDTDIVYNDLINFWPKLKKDGVIGGDDIFYDEVSSDIDKFKKEHKVDVKYSTNGFMITK